MYAINMLKTPNIISDEVIKLFKERIVVTEDGQAYWAMSPSQAVKEGDRAGVTNSKGYVHVKIKGITYPLHRLIWATYNGDPGILDVDHINGNPSDNRIENLRAATRSVNIQNRGKASKNSKTGRVGVTLTNNGLFVARGYKNRYLGCYDTADQAEAAVLTDKTRADDGFIKDRFAPFEEVEPSIHKIRSSNKSGYTGVSFHKSSGKWMAESYVPKKYLGLHDTKELAAQAVLSFKENHSSRRDS